MFCVQTSATRGMGSKFTGKLRRNGMPELKSNFRRSLKRKAAWGALPPKLILWFADSFSCYIVFPGCGQVNRVRPGPWNLRTIPRRVRPYPIFLRPGVTVLLVTFGGWDPHRDRFLLPMREAAFELLGSRGADEVTDVWVSGGINHFRDRPPGSTAPRPPAASDLLGRETIDGLTRVFEAVAPLFPKASLHFLGSGYMPEGRPISPHDIPHQLEINRTSRGVFDGVRAYLNNRVEQASEQEREARGPSFASAYDLYKTWDDSCVGDWAGHPNDRGHAQMVRRLNGGPSRGLLAQDQNQSWN